MKKLSHDAKTPTKANHDDLGIDFYSIGEHTVEPQHSSVIPTGICLELVSGTKNVYGIVLKTRSSHACKGLMVGGGVIDPGYRGEIKVILTNFTSLPMVIPGGTKIAQGVITKMIDSEIVECEDLAESPRGDSGFGSSGL